MERALYEAWHFMRDTTKPYITVIQFYPILDVKFTSSITIITYFESLINSTHTPSEHSTSPVLQWPMISR
jgi:hypothetical protein